MKDRGILECVLCGERYSVEELKNGLYYVSTGVCLSCYKTVPKKKSWCFGHYNPVKYWECRGECMDSKVCRKFTNLQEQ